MNSIRTVALAATVGNMLQGWDGAAIAGALLYLQPEFGLEDKPAIEGLIVACTLIGAVLSTAFAGPTADWLGRRAVLRISGIIFSLGGCIMVWSPNVLVLIAGRLLTGSAIGLASTISPIFISESSPTEIRGQLATLPQLSGSAGMFLAYCLAFGMSLMSSPNWRIMLGIIIFPSLLYILLCTFYLPESPRWLVSKGRMAEAKRVLQTIRNKEDVGAELALLVEGLGHGNETIEEFILLPSESIIPEEGTPETIKLFGGDDGQPWVATSITDDFAGARGMMSRKGSIAEPHSVPFLDSVVTLMGSLQINPFDNLPQNLTGERETEGTDEENPWKDGYHPDPMVGDMEEDLAAPLLPSSTGEKLDKFDTLLSKGYGSRASLYSNGSFAQGDMQPYGSFTHGSLPVESVLGSSADIGGGWELAWQWKHGGQANPEAGSFKRVFLHRDGIVISRAGSIQSMPRLFSGGESDLMFQASALVGKPAQSSQDLLAEVGTVGPAMVHPAKTAFKGPAWSEILEPGVKHALIVGCSLQMLQQFSGINAVLYYTPQILQAAGAEVLLANAGIDSESSSILASGVSSLLMLPCILVAVRLMDRSGRRQLLLVTLPILAVSLVAVILTTALLSEGLLQAIVSYLGLATFTCCFVMGFGPIPNILCSEIFPTRARGVCIGLCSATMWLCNVAVTYSFPAMAARIGLKGVFSLFTVMSLLSWVFVYRKVPETKGIPLEIISEFFAVSSNKA